MPLNLDNEVRAQPPEILIIKLGLLSPPRSGGGRTYRRGAEGDAARPEPLQGGDKSHNLIIKISGGALTSLSKFRGTTLTRSRQTVTLLGGKDIFKKWQYSSTFLAKTSKSGGIFFNMKKKMEVNFIFLGRRVKIVKKTKKNCWG